ncbi:jg7130 [Pararge aegeria aegeria]|uniref:Jg7130 protein n=1 Tax=Pararge aegeria aegeria TaxID=348720 RepID=A0A8S4S6R0_9NEOP|nr:jg7130 [Pararge aegeria aegeria]
MEGGDWRNNIISELQARNKRETSSFQDIIAFQSRLFDNVSTLKNENLQLTLLNERIRFSSTESVLNSGGGASNERIQALEQKILSQQEELTSLHRRRGESSQQIINLNARVHDLEKSLQAKDLIISENTALIASLRAEIQMYETNMTELQGLNQVLRDEHQALQIAFAAIEDKLRKAQDENRSLVERLIKYKAKDADKMNEENEHFLKSGNPSAFFINTFGRVSFGKKSDKVRKELEEACKESGSRSSAGSGGSTDEKIIDSLPYYATTLPTKVALRFDAHDGEVNAVKWSPTDHLVATGGADRKVKLWNVSKIGVIECKGTLVGSNAGVMSVDFDATGAYIVGASNDFASRVWTVSDQRLRNSKVRMNKFLQKPARQVAFLVLQMFMGGDDPLTSGIHISVKRHSGFTMYHSFLLEQEEVFMVPISLIEIMVVASPNSSIATVDSYPSSD